MVPPIALPLGELAPPPSLFTHHSPLHGQSHVARVMVHAFRLIAATGWSDEVPASGPRCISTTSLEPTTASATATAPMQ